MTTNTVIFDQIYRMLEARRTMLRAVYDKSLNGYETEEIYFYIDTENQNVILGDETDDNVARCVLSHDNRNSDLRSLSRDVMYALVSP